MRKKLLFSFFFVAFFGALSYFSNTKIDKAMVKGIEDATEPSGESIIDPYALWRNWKRPEGPPKVAIQVGHWKVEEVPDELENLRNSTGTSGGGKTEVEVNLAIAERLKGMLEYKGVQVEILPATVPPRYWADVFIAIHADGNTDRSVSGYKFASPHRDLTGNADELVTILDKNYKEATKLAFDPNITSNMRGYYAFSWWKYENSIHPMTTAVIAELGFLTNRNDQKLLINKPNILAKAISDGILEYLRTQELL